jgi:hypothetical protein
MNPSSNLLQIRQWTLIDQQDFRQLGYLELLNKNFEKEATAPHVAAMHKRFNKMVSWVGAEIISGANPKQRAKTVTFFIALARALLEMQNFHGLMAVGSGLAQMPVARLKETWKVRNLFWPERRILLAFDNGTNLGDCIETQQLRNESMEEFRDNDNPNWKLPCP